MNDVEMEEFVKQIQAREGIVTFVTDDGTQLICLLQEPYFEPSVDTYLVLVLKLSVIEIKKECIPTNILMHGHHIASQKEIDWVLEGVDDRIIGVYDRIRSKIQKQS